MRRARPAHRADDREPRRARARVVGGARETRVDRVAPRLRAAGEHEGREQAQHRRALRPEQRVLRAVARPHHDILLRGFRPARRDARGGADREDRPRVPEAGSAPRRPSARDRDGLGQRRDPRRAPVRVPRDDHDDLRGAARLRRGARARARARGPDHAPERGLPGPDGAIRQGPLDRDDRGRRAAVPRRVLPDGPRASGARRAGAHPGDHDPRAPVGERRAPAGLSQEVHFPRLVPALAPRDDPVHGADGRPARARLRGPGPHYAETLRRWRAAFTERLDDIRALGFDERFARMWRYYFEYCEGAFEARHCSVSQILLDRALARRAPLPDRSGG